jgi:hypothetical protein
VSGKNSGVKYELLKSINVKKERDAHPRTHTRTRTQTHLRKSYSRTESSEVMNRASLFNGTFVSSGDTLTVNVLKSDLVSNASFSVNVTLGYEVMNTTDTHAFAVLPFNIQPTG